LKNKKKKFIVFIYALVLILAPFKLLRESSGQDQRNADVNTLMETVNIGYPILKAEMYKDMGIILTNRGVAKITSGGSRWIWHSSEMGYPQIVKRENEDIYVVDSKNKLFKINFSDRVTTDSELDIEEDSYITQGMLDKDGYAWFLSSSKGKKNPKLVRMDLKDQKSKKSVELPVSIYMMKAIGSDSTGKVWFVNESGKEYELLCASYDSSGEKLQTKSFKLDKSEVRFGVKFVIDKYDYIWQFQEDNMLARKLYVFGDNIVTANEVKLNEAGEPSLDANGDIWLKVVKPSKKVVEFKLLRYDEFELVYILPKSYESYSIADETNLLQTYRNFGLAGTSTDFKYGYLAINATNQKALKQFAIDRVVTETQEAKGLVKLAKTSLAYIDYKNAYTAVTELPVKEQKFMLSELEAIQKDVFTEDIKKVQDAIKAIEKEKNIDNYYDIMAMISSEVKLQKNKEYLMAELDLWEDGYIFTTEVIEATDAISKAWKLKDEKSIAEAEIAVSRVKGKENQKWLMDQIDEIRDSIKKSQNK
jgi:hypothetical protein